MKKLKLIRFKHTKNDTQGLLMWDQPGKDVGFLCFTIEDEHRDVKVMHETRIPEGIYKLKLRNYGRLHTKYLERYGSEWHQGMLELIDVPGFSHILIHCGNTEKDTSGCILLGDSLSPGYLGSSRDAYQRIYPQIRDLMLAGEEVILEVVKI